VVREERNGGGGYLSGTSITVQGEVDHLIHQSGVFFKIIGKIKNEVRFKIQVFLLWARG
jgi:hypothetical protein